jgi:hypothetical protein
MNIRFIWYGAIIIAFAGACSKEKKVPVAWIDKNLKRNFSFQKGSYWIYRDANTGLTDSGFIPAAPVFNVDPESSNNPREHMQHSIRLAGTDNAAISYYLDGESLLRCLYTNSTTGDDFSCFYVELSTAFPGKIWPDSTFLEEIYPTYTLNGQEYKNVLRIGAYKLNGSPGRSAAFWFNDSIGMIRMDVPYKTTRKILELERCRILRD